MLNLVGAFLTHSVIRPLTWMKRNSHQKIFKEKGKERKKLQREELRIKSVKKCEAKMFLSDHIKRKMSDQAGAQRLIDNHFPNLPDYQDIYTCALLKETQLSKPRYPIHWPSSFPRNHVSTPLIKTAHLQDVLVGDWGGPPSDNNLLHRPTSQEHLPLGFYS